MKRFNAITGVPRSGSTLLCNILSQNPAFKVNASSPLAGGISLLSSYLSGITEIKTMLAEDREGTERWIRGWMQAGMEGMYEGDQTYFDKGWPWSLTIYKFNHLFPDAKMICLVRDLRAVFGSIQHQHLKFPELDIIGTDDVMDRARTLFNKEAGTVGMRAKGVENMIRSRAQNIMIVKYEEFVAAPRETLENIYKFTGEPLFAHDFDNVENLSRNHDELYINKYPHIGVGKVEQRPETWRDYTPQDVEAFIMENFQVYNKMLGYG